MATIRLISTDLDGTLLGGASVDAIPAPITHRIAELKSTTGVLWVINTGRSLHGLLDGPYRNTMFRTRPDYLVVSEALIYRRRRGGRFTPLRRWNRDVGRMQKTVLRELKPMLREWRREIESAYPCRSLGRRSWQLWFRAEIDVAERIEADLAARLSGRLDALVYRNGADVYLGFTLYTKGSALAEIALIEGIPRDEIFAVGDGPNDLSMLDGSSAAWVAAVANAEPAVIERVRAVGGYVAGTPFADGVLEALRWAEDTPGN